MNHWLFKTEPGEFSIDDLAAAGSGGWDGVRNYQARNRLRDQVRAGDRVLIQHSGIADPAVVGLAEVIREGYPDPTQFDPTHPGHDEKSRRDAPRWFQVDLRFLRSFATPVPLKALRRDSRLTDAEPVRRPRLSIQRLEHDEFRRVLELAGEKP